MLRWPIFYSAMTVDCNEDRFSDNEHNVNTTWRGGSGFNVDQDL